MRKSAIDWKSQQIWWRPRREEKKPRKCQQSSLEQNYILGDAILLLIIFNENIANSRNSLTRISKMCFFLLFNPTREWKEYQACIVLTFQFQESGGEGAGWKVAKREGGGGLEFENCILMETRVVQLLSRAFFFFFFFFLQRKTDAATVRGSAAESNLQG